MTKAYACTVCNCRSPVYVGQCPQCNNINSFRESIITEHIEIARADEVLADKTIPRFVSGLETWDRANAGGTAIGTSAVIAGGNGVGKSTLLMQLAGSLALAYPSEKVIYLSSEENLLMLRLRADRLGVYAPNLLIASLKSLVAAKKLIEEHKATIAIYDSLQEFGGFVKRDYTTPATRIIVSQVNAGGSVRGSTSNEHGCDALIFAVQREVRMTEEEEDEGQAPITYFTLTAEKNRNGATGERCPYVLTPVGIAPFVVPKRVKKKKEENDE